MSKRPRDEADLRNEVLEAVRLVCGSDAADKRSAEDTPASLLTPLERQVVELKRTLPPHVVLMVACGYRVKFYGRDSHVISRRTGIMCIPGKPFEYSSVPYTRVNVYIHRLVEMGYHVGFADQESAAVRAVEGNKGGIFTRSISQLFSRGTLLPGERVQTIGEMSAEAAQAKTTADESPEEQGYGNEAEGEEAGGLASSPAVLSTRPASSSEWMLLFVDYCEGAVSSSSSSMLRLVLVSFVTHRRLEFQMEASNVLAVEDVLQRYDIAEVILLGPTPPPSPHAINPATALLQLLPENIRTLLFRLLPLHLGPTINGEEDNGRVSVSFASRAELETVETSQHDLGETRYSIDDSIIRYLEPYKLNEVYRQLVRKSVECSGGPHGSGEGGDEKKPSALELPASTLRALELFHSSSGAKGSLFHLLNFTRTASGSRRLRQWLSEPLATLEHVMDRQRSVKFLVEARDHGMIEELLSEATRVGGSDMESILARLHAQRCSVKEYLRLLRSLRTLCTVATQLMEEVVAGDMPQLLASLVGQLRDPALEVWLQAHAGLLQSTATSPLELFMSGALPRSPPEAVKRHMGDAAAAQSRLDEELQVVRKHLGMPDLEYRTIAGTPFVVDVPSARAEKHAGKDWLVISRTKTNVRYHTPVIVEANVELCAAKERMAGVSRGAWAAFQTEFYSVEPAMPAIRVAVAALGSLDALHSLAVSSRRHGYVAPTLLDHRDGLAGIHIEQGRHPVADEVLQHQYVACDVTLGAGHTCLLTGPNMGGKSAFMRMIGVFVVLAQLGCYVPAKAATLPLHRGVYCRMGASDNVLEGRSTFFSEMQETSRILAHDRDRLSNSLVLMDELGRGTSSYDGMAVAAATLEYLVQHGATAVFVTHYTNLCQPYTSRGDHSPLPVECFYMGFHEEADAAGSREGKRIVFTYLPCPGVAPSSFGVEVAKMAGLPAAVTKAAAQRSQQTEEAFHLTQDISTLVSALYK